MSTNTFTAGSESGALKPLVPPEHDPVLLTQQVRASIVSNVLQKAGIGLGVGLALSFGLFRRRAAPIFFSTGYALGLATEQGNQAVRGLNERIRQNAIDAAKNQKPAENPFVKERTDL